MNVNSGATRVSSLYPSSGEPHSVPKFRLVKQVGVSHQELAKESTHSTPAPRTAFAGIATVVLPIDRID